MDAKRTEAFVSKQWQEEILRSLMDYIKIPNKSPHFDAHWQENGHMDVAMNHVVAWCEAHPLKHMQLEVLRLPNRTPLLWIEVPGDCEETVLLYGHLDKQPEMVGWEEGLGPWIPVIRDNRLYGRGSADDGYAIYAAMTAIAALQEQDLKHPRCVIIIEACEESGSHDLPFYIDLIKDRLSNPKLVICLDSGAGNYEQLWLTTSLRGNIVGTLSVELVKEGVHSGMASGIIADSFRVARRLLDRIEDAETGEIKLSALCCEIPKHRIEEAKACAAITAEHTFTDIPIYEGVLPMHSEPYELILNRTWRAALTVTGAQGLPSLEQAGNVLRPQTVLKLSMRVPPSLDAECAAKALEDALTANAPYQAKVVFKANDSSNGWQAPTLARWLQIAIEKASMDFFQKSAVYTGEGGSIPFMGMLGEKFPEAQFMITGVLGPHSNAHGPNEFLHLDMAKKVTCCVAAVIQAAM